VFHDERHMHVEQQSNDLGLENKVDILVWKVLLEMQLFNKLGGLH